MKILVSNDDGIDAPGIHRLAQELKKLGQVTIVAPTDEKSTTGHSLTIHKPLRVIKHGKDCFAVSGSPADCVYIGVREIIGSLPDLVVSGINRGANLGQDIYYSGTVSAAREACMLGIKSFAVSLAIDFKNPPKENKINYEAAAKHALKIIKQTENLDFPKFTLLNINVPDLTLSKIRGVRATQLGFRYYSGSVLKRRDHRGKDYFWVGGQYKGFDNIPGTDCLAVHNKFVSVTPIKLDSTDSESLDHILEKFPDLQFGEP